MYTGSDMKICVVGTGYVGLSNAVLLAQKHEVWAVDIVPEKVNLINQKKSPIVDKDISEFLTSDALNLRATINLEEAVKNAKLVIIATPTDYDVKTQYFNTSSVDSSIKSVSSLNPEATIIVKSTVPVGYTEGKHAEGFKQVIFMPEFLREGRALYDNLYPSRIVIGGTDNKAHEIASIFVDCAKKADVKTIYAHSTEAEAIKLFANTYLATRVAFFNELDSYAIANQLDSKMIIEGVTADPRIGDYYCNPSFGYGGYCLPKDTKQLLANFKDIPQNIIQAVVEANRTRKDYIAELILEKKPKVVGIYRLIMKSGSDNFRASAIQGIMRRLADKGVTVILYEPLLDNQNFFDAQVVNDLKEFKEKSDVIVSNRWADDIIDVKEKVFTRDLFKNN